jgi:hypothetical protein
VLPQSCTRDYDRGPAAPNIYPQSHVERRQSEIAKVGGNLDALRGEFVLVKVTAVAAFKSRLIVGEPR